MPAVCGQESQTVSHSVFKVHALSPGNFYHLLITLKVDPAYFRPSSSYMDDSQEHVISLALIFWEAATATVNNHACVQWEKSSAGIAGLLLLWALECQLRIVL